MHVEITPVSALQASIRPPGSKSITNRALLCAALSSGTSQLEGVLDSDDTQAMIAGLGQLGISVNHDPANARAIVQGGRSRFAQQDCDVYCENSGTTIRFLCAAATLGAATVRLDGNDRMRERPIGDLLDALAQLGGTVQSLGRADCPPVQVGGGGLAGGHITVSGAKSSQFLSALLMASPGAKQEVVIEVDSLVSRPYVLMTQAVMASFGVDVDQLNENSFRVQPAEYTSANYQIEPDASAASYFWAAAAITGGEVRVEGLFPSALQGDVGFCQCLEEMGCAVRQDEVGLTVTGVDQLQGIDVDMCHISDTVQTLAVVALFANGPTRITGVEHIRRKETDRIGDLARELRKCGAAVDEHQDGLVIHPPESLQAASIATYDDHRMAMSFAIAGLRQPGMVIEDSQCVGKTYPRFFDDLETLE